MLEGLFEDENDQVQSSKDNSSKSGVVVPPSPRLQCGLCGISNQGATCYLNSLLQTLLLTPEFRGEASNHELVLSTFPIYIHVSIDIQNTVTTALLFSALSAVPHDIF